MTTYPYVGRADTRAHAEGSTQIRIARNQAELAEHLAVLGPGPLTYVIDLKGWLRIAPRRSEHVASAQGGPVLSAGEVTFEGPPWSVIELSNQSTGFCPSPDSFEAVRVALQSVGVEAPPTWTRAFEFRRCTECGSRCLIKDAFFECACGAELPRARNF